MSNYQWLEGADPDALAATLADDLAAQINQAIAKRGRAIVAFSGGSTPKPLFAALARRAIDWSAVIITLVDERWVPESHALSNAVLLRRHLLSDFPESTFIPLYQNAIDVAASLSAVLENYCQQTGSPADAPAAFDAVVLGMGGDGHTASFFPDADNIAELINPQQEKALLSCSSASTQVPRVTWSLPRLLAAEFLVLHFTGADKRVVFNQAAAGASALELPIAAVLKAARPTPLQVYYAA